jgi:dihydropteroate synthase
MPAALAVRNHLLTWGARTYVMGILNVTPDSFSGDGLLPSSPHPPASEKAGETDALDQALRFLAAGADILDVGGESTRPGAQPVGADEELARVIPVIQEIRRNSDCIISVDTYKASVAEAALEAGADMVNDVWGLRADPALAEAAARREAPVILMHNRSKPANAEIEARLGGRYVGMNYTDLLEDIKRELLESVALAEAAGVRHDSIILDPGIGFGKTVEQNLALINRLDEIKALGFPVLLGPSRKSFIGYTLNLPPGQRQEGTAAAVAVGILRGADIVRVHDVEAMTRVARMTDALVRQPA